MYRVLLLLALLLPNTLINAQTLNNESCQECHGVEGFSSSIDNSYDRVSLHIDGQFFEQSVHSKYSCVECHDDIEKLPHKNNGLKKVDCISCHKKLDLGGVWSPKNRSSWLAQDLPRIVEHALNYQLSAHSNKDIANNATCATCHTAHYVFPSEDKRALTYKSNSPLMCGSCHQKELKEYKTSVHGSALNRPWKGEIATCSDCHSSHKVTDSTQLPAHRLVTVNCGNCHENALHGYMVSPHGQLAWHGNEDAPKCVDCHSDHNITHIEDKNSIITKENKVKVCQKCHEDANEQFAKYHPHGSSQDFDKYPLLWVFGKGMGILIILVMLFFYLHSILWFYREKKERPVKWIRAGYRSLPVREKQKKHNSGVHFKRFSWGWRVNHWFLAISLMILVFTGMAVMFPDTSWSMALVPALGGSEVFNILHRVAGIIFLLTIITHAVVVVRRIKKNKNFDWFGPNSLLPRKKDWEDMKGQFRWFFGKGKQPQFDRWTYWEKFDYWAVYWGALVIGLSGLMLWFYEEIGLILPGWIFNIATIAHGLEAFLAVMTLFVVHFFNNHFRPSKFPLDTVMFTGSWDLEELKEERPEEYKRLKETGELEQYLVKPPSKRWNIISHILGFVLLSTGLVLLILVIQGFFIRGLF